MAFTHPARKNDFRFAVRNSKVMRSIWTNRSTRRGFRFFFFFFSEVSQRVYGCGLTIGPSLKMRPCVKPYFWGREMGVLAMKERGFVDDGLFAAFCFFGLNVQELGKFSWKDWWSIWGWYYHTPCPKFVFDSREVLIWIRKTISFFGLRLPASVYTLR